MEADYPVTGSILHAGSHGQGYPERCRLTSLLAPSASRLGRLPPQSCVLRGYRRDHVRAFAQRVEVADDAIYLKGNKNVLLRTLIATKGGKSAGTGVPGFIPRWRRARA